MKLIPLLPLLPLLTLLRLVHSSSLCLLTLQYFLIFFLPCESMYLFSHTWGEAAHTHKTTATPLTCPSDEWNDGWIHSRVDKRERGRETRSPVTLFFASLSFTIDSLCNLLRWQLFPFPFAMRHETVKAGESKNCEREIERERKRKSLVGWWSKWQWTLHSVKRLLRFTSSYL